MGFLVRIKNNQLYLGQVPAERLAKTHGTPLYVYEADVIRQRYADLTQSIAYDKLRIHYACKANSNVEILKLLRAEGANVETVSKGEVLLAFQAGFWPAQIIHTCSNMSADELRFLLEYGITVNLDSLGQLQKWGEWKPGSSISIRINQGIGAGHHPHVITGGPESKFGIDVAQLDEAKALARSYGLKICGIHQHIGSNVLDADILLQAMQALLQTAATFPDLEFVDIGGGLGVPYKPEEKPLNMRKLGREIGREFSKFCASYGRPLTLILEPGRYLVAEAGTLLTAVTDVKRTPFHTFVGVDTGFNHLIRPAMYGSYHPIINASKVRGKQEAICVAGNLCEAGDVFARDRLLTTCKEGDILAILNAGAYGYSMSSNYNSRPKPAEVLVSGNESRVIREREKV
jgi:diaminopimelate decarboxylase